MGMRAIGRVLGIHHKTVSRWLVQAAQALPASPPQTEVCSFIEIDEFCTFITKKSQCWLWLAWDSIFGKVLGFVCGRRTIKTGKVLWQQIKHLPTLEYGTEMLKPYENFIPHAEHSAGKTSTTKSNHSTAD
jgi:IS1 family transposase